MAYTTPRTYVAGEVHTAAHHNTYERDNIAWLATDSPSCRVYHTSVQSVPNNVFTSILYGTERFDNAAMHSTSTNTSRITVPSGGTGKYVVIAQAEFANGSGAGNVRSTRIALNATTPGIAEFQLSPTTSHTCCMVITTVYALATAGDYVETQQYQDSGGAMNNVVNNPRAPEFMAFWFRT